MDSRIYPCELLINHLVEGVKSVDGKVWVWELGAAHTELRDVDSPGVLAEDHQGRGHRALDVHLFDGSEGVSHVVILEQKDGLIEKHARTY